MIAHPHESLGENPWSRLDFDQQRNGEPWYVLPEDESVVVANNARRGAADKRRIQTQLVPEPYLGRLDAPVIFFNVNPHYSPGEEEHWHARPDLKEAFRRNFSQETLTYPHIFLDPRFKTSPGGVWWRKRLRHLIGRCTLESVAHNLLAVEYFPYHSLSYPGVRVESEAFSRRIIVEAMERSATIIVARHWNELTLEIPALRDHGCLRTVNWQNVILTPTNLPGFWDVAERIKRGN